MEIIAELERLPRGPYAGGVGYLSFNGNLDSAITIRSAFVNDGNIRLQAGAGIVADSDPKREFEETGQKLGALVDALKRCSFQSKRKSEAMA
jgi:anthranilate synthase component 1